MPRAGAEGTLDRKEPSLIVHRMTKECHDRRPAPPPTVPPVEDTAFAGSGCTTSTLLRAHSARGQILRVDVPVPRQMEREGLKVRLYAVDTEAGTPMLIPLASAHESEVEGDTVIHVVSRRPVNARTVIVKLSSSNHEGIEYRAQIPASALDEVGAPERARAPVRVPYEIDDSLLEGVGKDLDSCLSRAMQRAEQQQATRAAHLREILEQRQEAAHLERALEEADQHLAGAQQQINERRATLQTMREHLAETMAWCRPLQAAVQVHGSAVAADSSVGLGSGPAKASPLAWRDADGLTDVLARSIDWQSGL